MLAKQAHGHQNVGPPADQSGRVCRDYPGWITVPCFSVGQQAQTLVDRKQLFVYVVHLQLDGVPSHCNDPVVLDYESLLCTSHHTFHDSAAQSRKDAPCPWVPATHDQQGRARHLKSSSLS